MPMVSLIVPVFNEDSQILSNLHAILAQADGDWYSLELIAVDDGSLDRSAHDKRIRSLTFARNLARKR